MRRRWCSRSGWPRATCSSTTSWSPSGPLPGAEARSPSPASSPRSGPATRARASTPTCSSSRTACCRRETSEVAEVLTTRVEPEIFVPPLPGARGPARRGQGARPGALLRPDGAQAPDRARSSTASRCTPTSSSSTAPAARTSTSAASRAWRPRPRYATFLLYSLFNSGVLGAEAINTKALIFNVKGEDLLFLDHPNSGSTRAGPRPLPPHRAPSRRRSTRSRSTRRRAAATPNAGPDVATRTTGRPHLLLDDRRVRRGGAAAVPVRRRRGRAPAVHDGDPQRRRRLKLDGQRGRRRRRVEDRRRARSRTFDELVELICRPASRTTRPAVDWAGRAIGTGTINAFIRRLRSAQRPLGHLDPRRRRPAPSTSDPHVATRRSPSSTSTTSHDRAKRFVVGVTIRARVRREGSVRRRAGRCCSSCSTSSTSTRPRRATRPIKEILLDVAERGRSLGIILIGAQQTASEVERRVIANSSIRVAGRLDPAEATRPSTASCSTAHRAAGHDRQARHDVRVAARDPRAARRRVPVPGVGDPARRSEAAACGSDCRPRPALPAGSRSRATSRGRGGPS